MAEKEVSIFVNEIDKKIDELRDILIDNIHFQIKQLKEDITKQIIILEQELNKED